LLPFAFWHFWDLTTHEGRMQGHHDRRILPPHFLHHDSGRHEEVLYF